VRVGAALPGNLRADPVPELRAQPLGVDVIARARS